MSSKNPNKMFHVNFLTIESKEFQDKNDFESFLDKNRGIDTYFDDGGDIGSYNNYVSKFYNISVNEDKKYPLRILENVSRIYINGNEEAYYNKSSYQVEDNDSLKSGAFYIFGKGVDRLNDSVEKFEKTEQHIKELEKITSCPCSEQLCQLYIKANEKILPNFISTEICSDLARGVRNKNSHFYYPQDLVIHIVPSNTLAFTEENLKNLPHHSRLIFHVDPQDAAFYAKIQTFSIDGYGLKFHEIGGIHSICSFDLGESRYSIKTWNLSTLLHSLL